MTRMTGGEAIVRALADSGIRTVFGIPGVHNLAIYDALAEEDRIRHVLARHEQGAAFMADGYARATGGIGVVLTTSGPGALNAITPLATAYADFSPVLCISSQIESRYVHDGPSPFRGILHEMKDQLGAMSTATGWASRVKTAAEIPGAMRAALTHLHGHRPTPAYIEVPFDLLSQEVHYPEVTRPVHPPVRMDSAELERMVAILREARRPLVVAGSAVVRAGASHALVRLAETLGAPVVTDALSKGVIPEDHPLSIGRLWRQSASEVDALVRESDVVLIVGNILRGDETAGWTMPLEGRILQIDPSTDQIGLEYPVELGVVGSPDLALEALLSALEGHRPTDGRAEDSRRAKEAALARMRESQGAQTAYLDAIRRAVPPEGILCCDMTLMAYLAEAYYPALAPRTFVCPSGFGTLGFALPEALGAKVGRPETPVVALCGEGGLQFTLQELATASQFGIAVSIVLFNDHTYSAVKRAQRRQYERRYIAVDLKDPDFCRLAGAYDLGYECADSPDRLEDALRSSMDRDTATLIEVPLQIESW